MRNARLSEVRCQKEVSESKAPSAGSIMSKVRRSTRLTEFSKHTVCPQGEQSAALIAARRTTCFKVDVGVGFAAKTRRAVKRADNFEVSPDWCSAKAKVASKSASRCACHRSPKKMRQEVS